MPASSRARLVEAVTIAAAHGFHAHAAHAANGGPAHEARDDRNSGVPEFLEDGPAGQKLREEQGGPTLAEVQHALARTEPGRGEHRHDDREG